MLLLVFLISIAILLLCIIKLKLNPFVALLVCAYGTGLMALATYAGGSAPENFSSIADVTACVTSNFGSTLGSIGIVTGLGVMLGMFMYESGGIDNIVDKVLKAVGPKRSQYAVSVAGFITGIPVFGDVVYIMFAPMLRVLSRKTGYSMAAYGCAISVATTCTFALVLPTAPPLAVAAAMDINVGIFFFYALIAAFVGMFFGGIVYGGIVNKQDQKAGKKWDFSDLDAELAENAAKASTKPKMGAGMAMSILLVPILLILMGSFSAFLLPAGSGLLKILAFLGDKNVAMTIGVLYGAFISRPHLNRSITEIMTGGCGQGRPDPADYRRGRRLWRRSEGVRHCQRHYRRSPGIPHAYPDYVLCHCAGAAHRHRLHHGGPDHHRRHCLHCGSYFRRLPHSLRHCGVCRRYRSVPAQ